jgi:hypothetical protein
VGAAHLLWLTFFKTPALTRHSSSVLSVPHIFWGLEMVYYDKALHQVLIQCHKVCHSMYLTNHRIDVDICVVAITTASVRHQLGDRNHELFYQGLLARIKHLVFS